MGTRSDLENGATTKRAIYTPTVCRPVEIAGAVPGQATTRVHAIATAVEMVPDRFLIGSCTDLKHTAAPHCINAGTATAIAESPAELRCSIEISFSIADQVAIR